jgi:hypothetical protein
MTADPYYIAARPACKPLRDHLGHGAAATEGAAARKNPCLPDHFDKMAKVD